MNNGCTQCKFQPDKNMFVSFIKLKKVSPVDENQPLMFVPNALSPHHLDSQVMVFCLMNS